MILMKLFFRTRDIGPANDYPAIGWMPPLPGGADRLWRRFGQFAGAEFPQMVLSQKHGNWELYLEGINSGRTDSATGVGGRIIRMSLYITGNTAEGQGILGLLSSFVFETLSGTPTGETLKNCFERLIKVGDPRRWKDGGQQIQNENAIRLLSGLKALVPPAIPEVCETGWAAGRSEETLMRFLGACRALLEGRMEGCALSLPYCRIGDADEVQRILSGERLVALLSGDAAEQYSPVRNISMPKRSIVTPVKNDSGKRAGIKAFFLAALAVVIVGLLVKSCTGKKQESMPKDTIEKTETSSGQTVTTNKTETSNIQERHGHTN